jgi:hypothetical protein
VDANWNDKLKSFEAVMDKNQVKPEVYYTERTDVARTKQDLLKLADFVKINECWCPVLGYEAEDDILCAESYTQEDFEVKNASIVFTHDQILIAQKVCKRG